MSIRLDCRMISSDAGALVVLSLPCVCVCVCVCIRMRVFYVQDSGRESGVSRLDSLTRLLDQIRYERKEYYKEQDYDRPYGWRKKTISFIKKGSQGEGPYVRYQSNLAPSIWFYPLLNAEMQSKEFSLRGGDGGGGFSISRGKL